MGLLDKLWDDVVAGPTPQSGLSRLRKQNSYSVIDLEDMKQRATEQRIGNTEFSRSQSIPITKPRPPSLRVIHIDGCSIGSIGCSSAEKDDGGTFLSTPTSASTPPMSPSSFASPSEKDRGKARRSVFHSTKHNQSAQKVGSPNFKATQPFVPTVYDWVVISALDK